MKARTTGTYAILMLAAALTLVLAVSRSACREAVYPVERAKRLFATHVVSRAAGMFRGAAAAAENVRLRREVASLSVLRGDVERLEAENDRLRRALGYAERRHGEWRAAGVLSAGGSAAGAPNVFRVDKGSLAGVREGAVVVAPAGLVGRVTAVAGDKVEIRTSGTVTVNGVTQPVSAAARTDAQGNQETRFTVPQGCLFILNAEYPAEQDGREPGTISLDSVDGKIITILRRRGL